MQWSSPFWQVQVIMLTAVRLPCHVSRASLSLYFLVYSAKDIRELRAFTDPSPSWEHALAVLKPHFDPTVTVPGLQVRTRRTSVTQSQASTDNASGITVRADVVTHWQSEEQVLKVNLNAAMVTQAARRRLLKIAASRTDSAPAQVGQRDEAAEAGPAGCRGGCLSQLVGHIMSQRRTTFDSHNQVPLTRLVDGAGARRYNSTAWRVHDQTKIPDHSWIAFFFDLSSTTWQVFTAFIRSLAWFVICVSCSTRNNLIGILIYDPFYHRSNECLLTVFFFAVLCRLDLV